MTEEAKKTTDANGDKFEFIATLVRGRRFTLGTSPAFTFEKGVEEPVSAKIKARLEKKAFDTVTVGVADSDGPAEQEDRPKFIFRGIGEPKPAPRAPGARSRAVRVHA